MQKVGWCNFVLTSFAEMMFSYAMLLPQEWDEEGLEDVCLRFMPKKIAGDPVLFKELGNILRHFFAFLDAEAYLPQAAELAKVVDRLGGGCFCRFSRP